METIDNSEININECNINELLPTLFRLQSQRCLTYQRLHDAQIMFFTTHNFPAFQNFLSDITIIFARISEEVLSIKKRLEDKKLIHKHIEQLQDYEQKKLQLTNELFLAKVEKKNDDIENINEKLTELIHNINEILEELRYDQEDFIQIET
ncbi:unnamed protein product [Adineta steineri]|uniref:Uncharacterized protein n=1 Tax=Adineta steineri TaxID=433720 RepID=A0A818NH85_9BILA|nr:unnamed protein product [Adineta steineri]CAF3604868.1 unnamed protein product [Adineta steineri]CAF3943171.1 unnamed protein product [Adineta steineri]